jgi:hypothetical protein
MARAFPGNAPFRASFIRRAWHGDRAARAAQAAKSASASRIVDVLGSVRLDVVDSGEDKYRRGEVVDRR